MPCCSLLAMCRCPTGITQHPALQHFTDCEEDGHAKPYPPQHQYFHSQPRIRDTTRGGRGGGRAADARRRCSPSALCPPPLSHPSPRGMPSAGKHDMRPHAHEIKSIWRPLDNECLNNLLRTLHSVYTHVRSQPRCVCTIRRELSEPLTCHSSGLMRSGSERTHGCLEKGFSRRFAPELPVRVICSWGLRIFTCARIIFGNSGSLQVHVAHKMSSAESKTITTQKYSTVLHTQMRTGAGRTAIRAAPPAIAAAMAKRG
eukprot:gene10050-biopygen3267